MSSRLRSTFLALVVFSLGACDGPTVPDRPEVYDFRLATTPPLVFHWPLGSEIRVHIAAGAAAPRASALATAAESAVRGWNDAAIYGEYRMTLAASPAEADVILRWNDVPVPVGLPTDPPVGCRFEVGVAVTTFCFDAERRLLVFPLTDGGGGRVRMVVTIANTVASDPNRLTALVTHEIGHVLGLWSHPDPREFPTSVMLSNPGSLLPARIDAAAVQVLYHTRSDVGL